MAREQGDAVEDYLSSACVVLGLTPAELADAWVLEEYPDETSTFDSGSNETTFRITSRYRLRPKTDEDRLSPDAGSADE